MKAASEPSGLDTNGGAADARFMGEALRLAAEARGRTSPNPMVGCVIVKNGEIVGRGFHDGPGAAHAEVAALNDAGDKARGASAYVTLEPCNHTGATPPCVDALIAAEIADVVYALPDPNPIAAGGALRLKAASIDVRQGPCRDEAAHLNRAWLHSLRSSRPYVIAKAAMSLDGRIATRSGESKWLTGPEARRMGHELRAASDAILVGAGTVVADDPALTARLDGDVRSPLRVVIDPRGECSPGAKAFERSGRGAVLAATRQLSQSRRDAYASIGVEIIEPRAADATRVDLNELLLCLRERNILSLMVEGGGGVLGSFLDDDLIDELHMFYAPILLGGGTPAFNGLGVDRVADANGFRFDAPVQIGPDFLVRGFRRQEL